VGTCFDSRDSHAVAYTLGIVAAVAVVSYVAICSSGCSNQLF
jgi:hypothetical protein